MNNAIFHQGSSIAVLLIHGLTGTPKEMDSVALRLRRYGFTVSIPLLPGHCRDIHALLSSDRHQWMAAIAAEYQRLRAEGYQVFAGGLSVGAAMAILLAHQFHDLRGLALYAITLKCNGWAVSSFSFMLPVLLSIPLFRNHYHFREAFPYGIKNEELRERILLKLESGDSSAAGHTNTPGVILRELLRIAGAAKKVMPQVKVPALLVHGREDDLSDISNSHYVQRHYAGETVLLQLEQSYHLVTVDQERHQVADATARFFHRQLNKAERNALAKCARKSIPPDNH
ncbi:alpha/beta fold hydrolase [Erwinia persicina]|uniref:alpha/beta hydrolase n=1 Tax=Erwinia persicina TaxID=55211 RepID=UPI000787742D|nr:alpha/beta fold hydrolase [Erwinia persicina]MCQ4104975.1 alpha/beta fold hydrolase [Erwinia persicina]UTX11911.1 alpha/beta fold hydrolase [Erwinia persicina]